MSWNLCLAPMTPFVSQGAPDCGMQATGGRRRSGGVMNRGVLLGLSLLLLAGTAGAQGRPRSSAPPPSPPAPAAGQPLSGLTAAQVTAFNDGKADFTEIESVADGLGPVFNERSCAACHLAPSVGGSGRRLVTRFGTPTNGLFDPLTHHSASLMQDHAIGFPDGSPHNFVPERVPQAATIVT